ATPAAAPSTANAIKVFFICLPFKEIYRKSVVTMLPELPDEHSLLILRLLFQEVGHSNRKIRQKNHKNNGNLLYFCHKPAAFSFSVKRGYRRNRPSRLFPA
ncbi:MAG: hypothetical protein NC323_01560, partial [Oxalobacter formigenes]|nr:hypothetical protein [Oxalobacter formigenes]